MKIADCEVNLIDSMGTDISVVNAARVSFHKESGYLYDDDDPTVMYLSDKDQKLLKFLADHGHIIPFAHAFLSFRLKIPIFIARQLGKHQVGLALSEVSRRYVDDEPEFFFPKVWRKRASNIKQGSSNIPVDITIKKHDDPYYVKFHNIQARAKREGIFFDLKFEDMIWPKECEVLGIPLVYDLGRGKILEDSPSIDRIDPNKPYIKENIRIISNKANTMKSNATKDELVKFAEEILLTYKGYIPDYEHSPEGVTKKALDVYNYLLSIGTCAEQARIILPLNMMTTWVWSGSLLAFIRVCNLRLDAHTQKETQDVAKEIAHHLDMRFPESWKVCKKFNENL